MKFSEQYLNDLKAYSDDDEFLTEEDYKKKTIENILSFTSEKLCSIIVISRYLNINNDIALIAMKELSNRRSSGDTFEFEDVIDSQMKTMPELNFSNLDIRDVLNKAKFFKSQKR